MLWTEFPLKENSIRGKTATGSTISEQDFEDIGSMDQKYLLGDEPDDSAKGVV